VADVVALTGATGFIGGAVARRLASTGWRVRALVRTESAVATPTSGVEPVRGALAELDTLRRLVDGARAVVHCAGTVRGATAADFHAANVGGVARLATAAAEQAGRIRVILVSSLAARYPELSPYAASKRAGERALADSGVRAAVLRPPAVYGPADREIRPLFRWMARGIAPVLGGRDNRFSLVFVDDLADAIVRLLQSGVAGGGVFELHDGRPGGYTWDDVRAAMARWRGRPVRALPISRRVLDVLARANVAMAPVRRRRPMLTPGKVRELSNPDWVCDNAALTAATGWAPRIDLDEGIRRTLGRP
jgi:nucleoside-diphosphate-sugar epimerase